MKNRTDSRRRRRSQRGGAEPVMVPSEIGEEFKVIEPESAPEEKEGDLGVPNAEVMALIPDELPAEEPAPVAPPAEEPAPVAPPVEEPAPVAPPVEEPVVVEPVEIEMATKPEGKGFEGAKDNGGGGLFGRLGLGFLTAVGGTEAQGVIAKYKKPKKQQKQKLVKDVPFGPGLLQKATRSALKKRPQYKDTKTGKIRNVIAAGSKAMDILSISETFSRESIIKNDDFVNLWVGPNQNLKWRTDCRDGRIYLRAVAVRDIQDDEILVIEPTNWPDFFYPKPSVDDIYKGHTIIDGATGTASV